MVKDTCSVEGCEQPRRKRGWCAGHYSMWYRTGEVKTFGYKWGEGGDCRVCGEPAKGRARYCGDACKALAHFHPDGRPLSIECAGCGASVDLTERGKAGRRRRVDTKLCRRCCRDGKKHGASVLALAKRDGADCAICHCPIDMTLAMPDRMSASVDHKTPRARGGTNDPENLQLAHLWCNQVKSDRVA